MKRTPNEQRIMDLLAPGALCRDGFLGDDRRGLQEILDTDRAAVEALGLTHRDIAGALDAACRAAMAGLGAPVHLPDGNLVAEFHEAMGAVPSPWGEGKLFAKGEVVVADTSTGERLVYTPLSVHLVGEHGFYQGRGSPYRIEPAKVARLFGLGKRACNPDTTGIN